MTWRSESYGCFDYWNENFRDFLEDKKATPVSP